MTFKLELDESVKAGVARTAHEQLARAERALGPEAAADPVAGIHSARKALKKQRALLRLTRSALPKRVRKRENAALRDTGRKLSGARDADVMIETLEGLHERYAGQLPATTFDAVREALEAERRRERARSIGSGAAGEALDDLRAIRSRLEAVELDKDGWKALEPGVLHSYRRGRKALRRARRNPTLENLHEWRKRVKDHWYHLRLLTPAGGAAVKGQANEAKQISELLGQDHDLGVLAQAVERTGTSVAADLEPLLGLIEHRRDELQRQALHAGQRLYAEKPKALRRRLKRRWKAGRAGARAAAARDAGELAVAADTLGVR